MNKYYLELKNKNKIWLLNLIPVLKYILNLILLLIIILFKVKRILNIQKIYIYVL